MACGTLHSAPGPVAGHAPELNIHEREGTYTKSISDKNRKTTKGVTGGAHVFVFFHNSKALPAVSSLERKREGFAVQTRRLPVPLVAPVSLPFSLSPLFFLYFSTQPPPIFLSTTPLLLPSNTPIRFILHRRPLPPSPPLPPSYPPHYFFFPRTFRSGSYTKKTLTPFPFPPPTPFPFDVGNEAAQECYCCTERLDQVYHSKL